MLGGSIWALINLTSWIDEKNRDNLYIIAPLQVILGSAVFLASITCIVVVFGRLGLFDRSKALGLPEGSVRALLALILLIIFVIFANIVFGNLSANVVRVRETFTGLTSTDIERLPGEVVERRPVVTTTVVGAPLPVPTFDGIYLEQRRDEDASALGQQIVTALITLVAAISAFYFGSGAVAAGTAAAASITSSGATGDPKGTLFLRRPSLPATLTRDDAGDLEPITIEIGGTVLQSSGVEATLDGDKDGSVTSNNNIDSFTYTPKNPTDSVTITFRALDGSGTTLKLSIAVPPPHPPVAGGDVAEPPVAGGDVAEPPGAGGEPPVAGGDVAEPPVAGGEPPVAGGDVAEPPVAGGEPPVAGGDVAEPPVAGGEPPVAGGDVAEPPRE